jgi:hypothetical protein
LGCVTVQHFDLTTGNCYCIADVFDAGSPIVGQVHSEDEEGGRRRPRRPLKLNYRETVRRNRKRFQSEIADEIAYAAS